MIDIEIPGSTNLHISHLVLDYNGTLALDGELLEGVAERMERLLPYLQMHVITADTHGTVKMKLNGLPCSLHIISPREQDQQKDAYVRSLGAENVVAIGNGRNDSLMLKTAALGFALIQQEGGSVAGILQADIVCTDILNAFDLLLHPSRLKATLRN